MDIQINEADVGFITFKERNNMRRLQLKIGNWLEFQIPNDFDENKLKGLKEMNLAEVIDITGVDETDFELVEFENWYEDVKFLGEYWIESGEDKDDNEE